MGGKDGVERTRLGGTGGAGLKAGLGGWCDADGKDYLPLLTRISHILQAQRSASGGLEGIERSLWLGIKLIKKGGYM